MIETFFANIALLLAQALAYVTWFARALGEALAAFGV